MDVRLKQRILLFTFFILFGGGLLFVQSTGVSATDFGIAEIDESIALGSRSIIEIVLGIIRIVLGLLGIIVLGLILYAGFVWMTANGDAEKIATAKKILLNAVIGLAIIMSAFTITHFIIRSLADATGASWNDDDSTIGGCATEAGCSPTFCSLVPMPTACLNQTFYVRSITPSTEGVDNALATFMNNAVVRVVFSRPVASGQVQDAVVVRREGQLVSTVARGTNGNRIIELTPPDGEAWETGAYTVEVDQNLRDFSNGQLQTTDPMGSSQPRTTQFYINRIFEDTIDPEIISFTINGEAQPDALFLGDAMTVVVETTDRQSIPEGQENPVGGIGVVTVDIQRGNGSSIYLHRTGPRVRMSGAGGSSVAFNTTYVQPLTPVDFPVGSMYRVVVTVYDIDGNSVSATRSFPIYPNHCNNGVQDANLGETDVDQGGPCGSEAGGSCQTNADCSPYMRCTSAGTCVADPIILDFDPQNAAGGNWVTISGRFFGTSLGTVEFGVPSDDGGDDGYVWTIAPPPDRNLCPVGELWHPTWTIVEVPTSTIENRDDDIAIRLTRAPRDGETNPPFDTTLDERGTTAQFTKDTTERPGLCTVISQDTGKPVGAPRDAVHVYGRGFINGTSELLWGDRPGRITAFTSSALLNSIVPEEFRNGVVGVRIQNATTTSNGIPFTVRTQVSESDPIISYIDPTTTTLGSYITIFGSGFGAPYGTVYLSNTQGNAVACAETNGEGAGLTCYQLNTNLPDACGVTWRAGEVVVEVRDSTKNIPVGTYALALRTVEGRVASGVDTLTIVAGPPRPSICKITPNSGPAPLATGETLHLVGANFGTNTTVTNLIMNGGFEDSKSNWSVQEPSAVGSLQGGVGIYTGTNQIKSRERSAGFSFYPGETTLGQITQQITGLESERRYRLTLHARRSYPERPVSLSVRVFPVGESDPIASLEELVTGNWNEYSIGFTAPAGVTAAQLAIGYTVDSAFTEGNQIIYIDDVSLVDISSTGGTVRFWDTGANRAEVDPSWLIADKGQIDSSNEVSEIDLYINTEIKTIFPLKSNGATIPPGEPVPIKVMTADEQESNAVTYTVNACTADTPLDEGFHCCVEGPEAGRVKPNGYACEGVPRSAGYTWRVASGLLPKVPRVLEQCYDGYTNDPHAQPPSPSPSTLWSESGTSACVNALVAVQFSMEGIASTTVIGGEGEDSSVRMYKCTEGQRRGCEEGNLATVGNGLRLSGSTLTIYGGQGVDNLESDTWYTVELDRTIMTAESITVAGRQVTSTQPLLATRPCGDDTAYCFDFKTSAFGEVCTMVDAFIVPKSYTIRELGPVLTRFGSLFQFQVWGEANQACISLPARGIGWEWDIHNNANVSVSTTVHINEVANQPDWDDVRTLFAQNDIAVQPLTLSAATTTAEEATITGTSTITIALGDPRVTTYWPNCAAACTNAMLGVQFNRIMMPSDIETAIETDNVTVYKCTDGRACSTKSPIGIDIPDEYIEDRGFIISPDNGLEPGTWYQVELKNIRAIGGYERDSSGDLVPLPGDSIEDFSWGFRTKESFDGCFMESLDITPRYYIARRIGERNIFTVAPFGRPDECSPYGQQLNPFDYDWAWTISPAPVDQNVVSIASNAIAPVGAPGCTEQCTPAGSTRRMSDNPANEFICGNGRIDPGETCDIGMDEEVTPTFDMNGNPNPYTCSYTCQRPGSSAPKCGDGILDNPIEYIQDQALDEADQSGVQPHSEACDAGEQNGKPGSGCSATCTLTGSAPTFTGDLGAPHCSIRDGVFDGELDPGEACEIDSDGRLVYLNHAGTEQRMFVPNPRAYCSDTCLFSGTQLSRAWCDGQSNRGMAIPECRAAASICGNGVIESGEVCEIISTNATAGTSTIRLFTNAGPTDPFATTEIEVPTTRAVQICTMSCLLGSICDEEETFASTNLWCDPEDEGCTSSCTLAGSSLLYSNLSQCRDTLVGTGEYRMCEVADSQVTDVFASPIQIATAIGESTNINSTTQRMESEISVTANRYLDANRTITGIEDKDQVTTTANYYLQCGFTEYATPVVVDGALQYNDAPTVAGDNPINSFTHGVATNSCLYERPIVSTVYPENYAHTVCRNTLMEVVFEDEIIERTSLSNNIRLAMYVPGSVEETCGDQGLEDVTDIVRGTIGDSTDPVLAMNFFERIWYSIKSFFARLIDTVFAYSIDENRFNPALNGDDGVWCDVSMAIRSDVVYEGTSEESGNSRIRLTISRLLDRDSIYALLLKSGANGITNHLGVPMRAASTTTIYSGTVFETGEEVCKIDHIAVDPKQQLFSTPLTGEEFRIETITARGERIVPIENVYDWYYSWAPHTSQLFDIPSATSTSGIATVSSTAIEAQQTALAQVVVTTDLETDLGDQTGRFFTDTTDLYARFCANFWPIAADVTGKSTEHTVTSTGYQNSTYHFRFSYCADAGSALTRDDDLPLFNTIQTADPRGVDNNDPNDPTDDIISRAFFFNTSTFNPDVLGVQVFLNPERHDPRTWYALRFGAFPSQFQSVTVDGYPAITNGSTYYIGALNIEYDEDDNVTNIYSNIYQFTINEGAQEATQEVFRQMIDSLKFNTNVTDHGYCLRPGSNSQRAGDQAFGGEFPEFACYNNFDCLDPSGEPLTMENDDGGTVSATSGICSNNRSALLRDLNRISDINIIQSTLESAAAQSGVGQYPSLASGTFYPGYSVSQWPSWGRFVGGIPMDPINRWTQCGNPNTTDQQTCWDPANVQYHCPAVSSVYEYAVASSRTEYSIHAQFEFLQENDDIVDKLLLDPEKVETAPWCSTPNTPLSPLAGLCGDGIVQPGEGCDPPGRQVSQTQIDGSVKVQTCSNLCTLEPWNTIESTATFVCSNGIIEPGEQCDAGARNGLYGSGCSASCSITDALSCGNNVLDPDPSGGYYEFCETVNNVCIQQFNNTPSIPMIYFVVDKSNSMNTYATKSGNKYTTQGEQGDNFDNSIPSRWELVIQNLPNIVHTLSQDVDVGVGVFSSKSNTQNVLALGKNHNAAAVLNAINPSGNNWLPAGHTWLKSALYKFTDTDNVFNFGDSGADSRPKSLVLIVDGAASDGAAGHALGDPLNKSLIEVIGDLYIEHEVSTYIIGVGHSDAQKNAWNSWAAAGGTGEYYSVQNTTELSDAIRSIGACRTYSRFKESTCNASCTGFGSYCGDGVVDTAQGEQCDAGDQNGTSTSNCTSYCRLPETPPAPPTTPNTGMCGDGIVQSPNASGVQEVCDLGNQNGIAPAAVYGERKTYCSADCTAVLTVDAAGYCGDGIVQTEAERCDVQSNGTVVAWGKCVSETPPNSEQTPRTFCSNDAQCSNGHVCQMQTNGVQTELPTGGAFVGGYSCTNTCQSLESSVVECKIYSPSDDTNGPRAAEGAIPKISVLNPLIGNNTSWRDQNQSGFTRSSTIETYWGNYWVTTQPSRYYYDRSTMQLFINNTSKFELGTFAQSKNLSIFPPSSFTVTDVSPWSFNYLLHDIQKPLKYHTLETNAQCSQKYSIVFNSLAIRRAANDGLIEGDQTLENNETRFSRFPYLVNNERTTVEQTIITSPAVPYQALRVVVKAEGFPPGVKFVGNLYHQSLFGIRPNETRVSYDRAKQDTPVNSGVDRDNVCRNMIRMDFADREAHIPESIANKVYTHSNPVTNGHVPENIQEYWWPKTSGDNYCTGYGRDQGNTTSGVAFVHDIASNQNNSVSIHSMTIDRRGISPDGSSKIIPFFVTGIGTNVQQAQHGKLTVEVYRYHKDQVPGYSFYLPDIVYDINLAEHSTNQGASFWHVFNIGFDAGNEYFIVNHNEGLTKQTDAMFYLNLGIGNWRPTHGKILTRYCDIRTASEGAIPANC